MKRESLTEKILDIKREKGWTWRHVCNEIGCGLHQVHRGCELEPGRRRSPS